MAKRFPSELWTYARCRSLVRFSPEYREAPQELNIKDGILKAIQKECAISNLCIKFKASERVVRATLEDLRDEGYQIAEVSNYVKIHKDIVPAENRITEHWTGDKIIRIGGIADCHMSSKYEQSTFLNHLYDIYEKECIQTVYNAGDLSEGFYKNRPGHIYEIHKMGHDAQADYIIENYPKRKGIVTKFITGNHDHTHILNGGVDIGRTITRERKDMIYLGQANAKVELTPNCVLELNHPLDGSAYALSYSIQKYIESMTGGEKPNILLNGHHHKAMYMFYRNVHAVEGGTTQAQTPFMKGKKLAAHIGGWIFNIHVNEEGTITRFIPEFIPLYKPIANDY